MWTFFAASSVSVVDLNSLSLPLIFLQEEEAEVECLCVVGGWLSTRVVWVSLPPSRVPPLRFVHHNTYGP